MTARNRSGTLRLYVAGAGDQSIRAIAAMRACAEALGLGSRVEVFDAYQALDRAREDGVVVLPTAVWCDADGSRRIIADVSSAERLLAALSFASRRTNRTADTTDHAPQRSSQY